MQRLQRTPRRLWHLLATTRRKQNAMNICTTQRTMNDERCSSMIATNADERHPSTQLTAMLRQRRSDDAAATTTTMAETLFKLFVDIGSCNEMKTFVDFELYRLWLVFRLVRPTQPTHARTHARTPARTHSHTPTHRRDETAKTAERRCRCFVVVVVGRWSLLCRCGRWSLVVGHWSSVVGVVTVVLIVVVWLLV